MATANGTIQLGNKVFDTITQFSGTVTAIAIYITGCRRCLVEPTITGVGQQALEGIWFDEPRLSLGV